MTWDSNGVWTHRLTNQEEREGGIWVIGSKPFDSSHDYPGKTSRSLMVKLWRGGSGRYGEGKYPVKDRLEDDLWEYVKVCYGSLQLRYHYPDNDFTIYMRHDLRERCDGVDIPPTVKRSWSLPQGSYYGAASGITICRRLPHDPYFPSQGEGYEMVELRDEPGTASWLPQPLNLRRYRHIYLQPFNGPLCFRRGDRKYVIGEGDFAFLDNSTPITCSSPLNGTHGFGIFF